MKTKITITVLIICAFFIKGCSNDDDGQTSIVSEDLINTQYPQAEQEVLATWDAIEQSLRDGDIDRLISFHGYSPKFTEFKNGDAVNGSAANEEFERSVFGGVTEVIKFDAIGLKAAVYGDVANLTFESDFHLKFGDNLVIVNEQTSLLFVKTINGWKIVHEHHSPWTQ